MTEARLELKYATGSLDPLACHADLLRSRAGFQENYAPRAVHSLYFDTRDFGSFGDHVDGNERRAKVRLRWYGPAGSAALGGFGKEHRRVALEIKRREGKLTRKLVFPVPPFTYGSAPLSEFAREAGVPLAEQLGLAFAELVPTALVSYERLYFVTASGVRCTLDFDLRCATWPRHLADATPSLPLTSEVLAEIKAPVARTDAAQAIAGEIGWRLTKHSKYVSALAFTG